MWPILIHGERDAVLVDTPVTNAQATALADWVETHGKTLTTIYTTHGHGDHFFGNGILLERFPIARAVATGLWNERFPGLIPRNIAIPERLEGDTLYLEDHELVVVDVGHTDTDDSTCLHVPSIGLVVAGDLAYNGVHQYFAESLTHQNRMEWITALDKIETLKPNAVIAGHKRETNGDAPNIIEETHQYIRDFDRLVDSTASTRELYDAMLALYPDRLNRALGFCARDQGVRAFFAIAIGAPRRVVEP